MRPGGDNGRDAQLHQRALGRGTKHWQQSVWRSKTLVKMTAHSWTVCPSKAHALQSALNIQVREKPPNISSERASQFTLFRKSHGTKWTTTFKFTKTGSRWVYREDRFVSSVNKKGDVRITSSVWR